MVLTNQPDIMIADKDQKTAVVIHVAMPSDLATSGNSMRSWKSTIWKVKAKVIPEVHGALGAVTPRLGE